MQNVEYYPFRSYRDAISCIRFKNPARQKSINLLEPERGSRVRFDPFDPNAPERIFAEAIKALKALKDYYQVFAPAGEPTGMPDKKYLAFLAVRVNDTMSPSSYAEEIGVSHMTVYRWLNEVEQVFVKELVSRGLLSEPEQEETKYVNARKRYDSEEEKKKREDKAKKKQAALHGQRDGATERVVYRG